MHLNKTDRTLDITVETKETIMENYDKLEQPWGLKAWTEQGVVEGRYYTSTCACLCVWYPRKPLIVRLYCTPCMWPRWLVHLSKSLFPRATELSLMELLYHFRGSLLEKRCSEVDELWTENVVKIDVWIVDAYRTNVGNNNQVLKHLECKFSG